MYEFLNRRFTKTKTKNKNLNLQIIRKESTDTSSLFGSYWGEQNNPQVRSIRYREKNIIADLLSLSIKSKFSYFRNLEPLLLEKMISDGYAEFGDILSIDIANKIRTDFENIDTCAAYHVWDPDKEKMKVSAPLDNPQGAFHTSDVMNNHALMDLFLNENVLDLVEGYLGAPARLFHVNTLCSFSSMNEKVTYGNVYHRDHSHPRFLVLFVYLNEVGLKNGPHQIYKSTHNIESFEKTYSNLDKQLFFDLKSDSYGYDEFFERNLGHEKVTITGPPGTCFLSDATGIHRGNSLVSGVRWLAWARYSLIPDDRSIQKFKVNKNYLKGLSNQQLYTISSMVVD